MSVYLILGLASIADGAAGAQSAPPMEARIPPRKLHAVLLERHEGEGERLG